MEGGIVGVFEIILMAPQVDEPVVEFVELVGGYGVGQDVIIRRNLAFVHIYAFRHGVDAGPEVGHSRYKAIAGGEHVTLGIVGGAMNFGARNLVAHLRARDFFLGGGTSEFKFGFVGYVAVIAGAIAIVFALRRENVMRVDERKMVIVTTVENIVGHLLEVGLGGERVEGGKNRGNCLASIAGGNDSEVKSVGFGHGSIYTFFFVFIIS